MVTRHTLTFTLLALLLGCGSGDALPDDKTPNPAPPTAPLQVISPVTPQEATTFAPSFAQKTGQPQSVDALLGEAERCGTCHQTQAQQWRHSAHSLAAFANPYYRASLQDYTAEHGAEKARFCNGCHDVNLTFQDKAAPLHPSQREGFAGVTCSTCHGITEATSEGNASYTLDLTPIPEPKDGDDASLQAHRARAGSATLRTNQLCMSCHRGFLGPATGHAVQISGIDEVGPWRRSGYAGSRASRIDEATAPQNCTSCHMPEGSHRFPGGHTALAAQHEGDEQLEAHRALLRDAVTMDIFSLQGTTGRTNLISPETLQTGDNITLDVVMRNERVGHHFPGGARDLRDTWVEIQILDAQGKTLASSGTSHASETDENEAYRLRAVMLETRGDAVSEHQVARFRTKVFDRTNAPRDAAVARYTWTLPDDLAPTSFPLRVQAKLRHRRIQRALHQRICEDHKTESGQAFAKATLLNKGFALDPCAPQPILEVASATMNLGPGAQAQVPDWKRLWVYGLGLSHHLQEHLPEARTALTHAQRVLPEDAPTWARASIMLELGKVAGRQGRTSQALEWMDKAEALAPKHPAIALARGDALAAVWRWDAASKAYRQATTLAPLDDRAWRGLTLSLGSLDKRQEALEAAQKGLVLEPRDPHLLRSQHFATKALWPGSPAATQAQDAWLAYKRDEEASQIQGRCADPSSACQQERVPIFARPLH